MAGNYRKKILADQGWMHAFDDVLIKPGFTNFDPNKVDISSSLGPYKFNIPIMSAAMDTVTGVKMAIQMALLGGLGVLHRNCSCEKRLEMVKKVKRARSYIVDDVATIFPNSPIHEAISKMEQLEISGLVVVDDNNKVEGILTSRDIPFDAKLKENGLVKDVMTKELITGNIGISRIEAAKMLYKFRKEKLPIIDKEGRLVGLITNKDLKPDFPKASLDKRGRLLCALAVSPVMPPTVKERKIFEEIVEYTDIFFIDVADFYKKQDIENTKEIMETFNVHFILGNIGTFEAAEYILTKIDYDRDKFIALKAGMGSGSICSTSIQTGVGAPTLFATAQIADAIQKYDPKMGLIADGGFKNLGDLPKAFTVGANMIMTGHFFGGCVESPGFVDTIQGRKVKVYRSMGSKEARHVMGDYIMDRYSKETKTLPEGVSDYIPFVGPVEGVIEQMKTGIRNGLVYAGAKNIKEMKNVEIGIITMSGKLESEPHDLIGKW
ncbi:Inosine-5'-monophosphate dehydrogenase [subsurface metagenome]